MFIMAKILALLSVYLSSSFFCNIILAPILFHVANMLWATVLAFLAGFLILVAKIKFVRKVLAAKVDVNIFNHTLALCLIASGNKRERKEVFSFYQVSPQCFSFLLQFGSSATIMER